MVSLFTDEELVSLAHHVGTSMPALFKLELDKLREDNARLQTRGVRSVRMSARCWCKSKASAALLGEFQKIERCVAACTWQETLSRDLEAVTDSATKYAEMLQKTETASGDPRGARCACSSPKMEGGLEG